jgi:hypothetical protein
MPKSVKLMSYGLLAVVAVAAGDLIAPGRATAAPQELILTEHATTDAVTDTGASGDSAGDILTFANEVFDAEDRDRVGSDQGMCVSTVAGRRGSASGRCRCRPGRLLSRVPSTRRVVTRSLLSLAAPAPSRTLRVTWC